MRTFAPEVQEAIIQAQDRFVWEAPEYERYERGPRWYIIMSLCAVFLLAYAIWTANFLFAVLIVLIAIIFILAGNEPPKHVLAQIGENGVVWNGHLYLFQDIETFAIIYEPPYTKVLYIESKSTIKPRLRIPLEEQDPLILRTHLKNYVQENTEIQDEYFSDILARLLRL